jgi:tRNA-Thr(GGU) m(6)t(6)A37 methyltransferase TsaA
VSYQPIATFRSSAIHPYEAPRQASLDDSGSLGTIELPSAMRETLKDLGGFERIWLIYDFHHNKSWKPLVLPPRGPHEKRGVFATRSPYRPNSIGLSSVELMKIEGTTLTVRATDLLDGSPILDIKPYVPYADSFPDAREGWLEGLEEQRYSVTFSPRAESQLKWLEAEGTHQIRAFAKHQLEFDPTDAERKRVTEHGSGYRLAYRTWRIDFEIDAQRDKSSGDSHITAARAPKTLTVVNIASGYSEEDLAAVEDKYGDKALHRAFNADHSP